MTSQQHGRSEGPISRTRCLSLFSLLSCFPGSALVIDSTAPIERAPHAYTEHFPLPHKDGELLATCDGSHGRSLRSPKAMVSTMLMLLPSLLILSSGMRAV
jgi:hypothetical protein